MIYLDVDGVLADFVSGACDFFDRPRPKEHDGQIDYHWYRDWGMSKEEFLGNLLSPEADPLSESLRPLPWAKSLYYTCDSYDSVRFLSAIWHSPAAWAGRLKWLKRHLEVDPSKVILVGEAEAKAHFATDLDGRANFLVDDREDNIEAWCAAGGRGFLWPGPANPKWSDYHIMERGESAGTFYHLCDRLRNWQLEVH